MSYSYIGHFCDVTNKKRLFSTDVSVLKNLNERGYDCVLENIRPSGKGNVKDYPDINCFYSFTFVNYFDNSVIDKFYQEQAKGNVSASIMNLPGKEKNYNGHKCYIADDRFFDWVRKEYDEQTLGSVIIDSKNTVMLFKQNITEAENGYWYTEKDFSDREEALLKEQEEAYKRLVKLQTIRDTKDWFEMSEDARNNYFDEVSYAEEDYQDKRWKYESIVEILALFRAVDDMAVLKNKTFESYGVVFKETKFERDKGDLELFIEVC